MTRFSLYAREYSTEIRCPWLRGSLMLLFKVLVVWWTKKVLILLPQYYFPFYCWLWSAPISVRRNSITILIYCTIRYIEYNIFMQCKALIVGLCLVTPSGARSQTTCLHPALSYAATSIFFQPYLKLAVHIYFSKSLSNSIRSLVALFFCGFALFAVMFVVFVWKWRHTSSQRVSVINNQKK